MSVPNQDIVKVGVRPAFDEKHKFCRTHLDALQDAMNNLKGETLKLWLYLNKNQDNYELELSQKACEAWGLKKDAYYTAKKKLIELGYLTPIREGSNIYIFSEKPKEPSGVSEKPKNLSEKPKTFSENQKDFSEKPQRNTTNTTNTTEYNIGVDEESLASSGFLHQLLEAGQGEEIEINGQKAKVMTRNEAADAYGFAECIYRIPTNIPDCFWIKGDLVKLLEDK